MNPAGRLLKEPLKNIGAQDILKVEYSHCGTLRKEGKLERNLKRLSSVKWRQYFVVISQGCTYIFNDDTSTSVKKCFSLKLYDKVERFSVEGPTSLLNFCFRLLSSYEGERDKCINFACSDDKQRKDWMRHFLLEIRKAHSLPTDIPTDTYDQIERTVHEERQFRPKDIKNDESDESDDDYDKINEKVVGIGISSKPSSSTSSLKRYTDDPTSKSNKGNKPLPSVPTENLTGVDEKTTQKLKPPVAPKPTLKKNEPVYGNIPPSYTNFTAVDGPYEDDDDDSYSSENESYDDVLTDTLPIFPGENEDATRIIRSQDNGVFLFRKGNVTPYVLVVRCGLDIKQYRIYEEDSKLRLSKERTETSPIFDNLVKLVEHYMQTDLPNAQTKLSRQYVRK